MFFFYESMFYNFSEGILYGWFKLARWLASQITVIAPSRPRHFETTVTDKNGILTVNRV